MLKMKAAVWMSLQQALWVALVVVGLVSGVSAQDAAGGRVARLTYVQGAVVVDRKDSTDGSAAQRNMALMEGMRLTTGEDGQAEVEFEDGSLVRATPNSSLELKRMNVDAAGNNETVVSLGYGMGYAELRAGTKFVYSFEAGSVAVSPVTNATVRVNLDAPPVEVAVLDGTVHVRDEGAANVGGWQAEVGAGETIQSDVTDSSKYVLTQQVTPDTWDAWNDARDKEVLDREWKRTSARDGFAGEAGYGWSDLDGAGTWYDVPGRGEVWQPDVASQDAADFDPYGSGAWVWYPVGGYVWASAYAWGWTPYRCGNWSYYGGFGWGWAPGAGCGHVARGLVGTGTGAGLGEGYRFNIAQAPAGYSFRPMPGGEIAGRGHPVVLVKPAVVRGEGIRGPEGRQQGMKTIGGVAAVPLRPLGGAPEMAKSSVKASPAVVGPVGGMPRMRPDPPSVGNGGAARGAATASSAASEGGYRPSVPGPRPAGAPGMVVGPGSRTGSLPGQVQQGGSSPH